METLVETDELTFKLIDEEQERQETSIELIASENFVSKQVMRAVGSALTNKYAEGLPGKRYYRGWLKRLCSSVIKSFQVVQKSPDVD